jgi:hypothetical protein
VNSLRDKRRALLDLIGRNQPSEDGVIKEDKPMTESDHKIPSESERHSLRKRSRASMSKGIRNLAEEKKTKQ